MKIKAIANLVTSKVGRQILIAQKHSPTLMFVAGAAGVVATVVLASRATLKLDAILNEHEDDLEKIKVADHVDYSDSDRQRDMVVLYARTAGRITRMYAPAIGIGILSIAALTGSHVVLTKRNVALTAAYAALDRGFKQYRERVVAELGPDKDRQFRYDMEDREIVEETKQGPKTKVIKQVGPNGASIYARFFDEASTSWDRRPTYNQMFLRCQQNYANDLLRARGHVFLNEVYDMLGLPRSKEGAIVGWVMDCCDGGGDNYIDFGVFEGDRFSGMRFVKGEEPSVLLDFNVDGVIYDKI